MERALASRAAGERQILNVETRGVFERDRRRRAAFVAAAAVAGLALLLVVWRTPALEAVSSQSDLRISPARPHLGDTLRITYRPSLTAFQREQRLTLRARLRTPKDDMYPGTVPGVRVRAVAYLERRADGSFEGRFALPDSIVFATLVVEDEPGEHLDDNSGRDWEILTYAADNRPTYETLKQRANDMMGRSWEEAYASALQLSKLYPDRISAWTLREFFDDAMFGTHVADSLGRQYEPRLDSLIAVRKTTQQISEAEIGDIFYRHLTKILHGGSPRDSVEFHYWRDRLLREYPRHDQVSQYYAISFRPDEWKRPEWMLDSLDRLYAKLAPLTGRAHTFFGVARQLVSQTKDDAVYRRWIERSLIGIPDSAYRVALAVVTRPALRADGERALRALLSGPSDRLAPFRRLAETQREYTNREADVRRTVLVALGRALAADGQTRAATDTLGRAATGVWNLEVFHALAAAYLTAGDTAAADRIRARVVADPRTPVDSVVAMGARGIARFGAATWDSLLSNARDEMYQRFLEKSKFRAVRGAPHVKTPNGATLALREVTGQKPALVIFWSEECGWALQALPAIVRVSERLTEKGIPVVLVASADGKAYLTQHGWKWPVYYDRAGEMKNAFVNFGTPAYYAMDASGRIRFDFVEDDEAELIGQLEALQSERQP